jgi:SAM-dependent methyltransferase
MQFMPANTFDLAFCFNVIQHLELATFARHLKLLYPALKPGGIFAFQFIYRLDGGPSEPELAGALQAGAMTHKPDALKMLATAHGYSIYNELDLGQSPWSEVGGHVLQIRR